MKKPYQELIEVLKRLQEDLFLPQKKEMTLSQTLVSNSNKTLSKIKDQKWQRLKISDTTNTCKTLPQTSSDNLNIVPREKVIKKVKKGEKVKKVHTKKTKFEEMEILSKENYLNLTMKSFIEVSVHTNLLWKAQEVVNYIRARGKKRQNVPTLSGISVFNLLLQGWAYKGNLKMVNVVLAMIEEEKLKPNIETYAAWLECQARQHNFSKQDCEIIFRKIEEKGFKIEDIYKHYQFWGDQEKKISKVIKKLREKFQYNPTFTESKYSCNILEELNTKSGNKIPFSVLHNVCDIDDLKLWAREQFSIEEAGRIKIKSINVQTDISSTTQFYREKLSECENEWREIISESFKRNIDNLSSEMLAQVVPTLYPYLTVLEPKFYVDILMQEIKMLAEASESFSPPLNFLCRTLGSRVFSNYLILLKKRNKVSEKVFKIYNEYLMELANPSEETKEIPRDIWQHLKIKHLEGPSIDSPTIHWPYHILLGVGKFLYSILLNDLKIDVNIIQQNISAKKSIPAFYKIFRRFHLHLKEEIKLHPVLCKLYRGAENEYLTFDSSDVPMVSPPLPWNCIHSGGLLIAPTLFIRINEMATRQKHLIEKNPPDETYPSLDALNVLGLCPWIINKPVLDVIIEVFNKNGDKQLDIPENILMLTSPTKLTQRMSQAEKIKCSKERMHFQRERSEMYSLWCTALYKLSIANHFRDRVFWYPHNMDFRGRVYPTPPHLNHLGGDFTRSTLMFAKGEPLGKNGLNWLKIHVINLTGLKKKEPISERLRYANEILPDIFDSADNPLNGKRWWSNSDEPWQTLAACKEIANAIRSGEDPSLYISHFPIHQDGSCNGLQHYAALGRDQQGAEQVNLCPLETPQDVYTGVANLVERERLKDAQNGVKIAQILEGCIKRKVVKQTVMTIVYGVTSYGAKFQILKQIKALENFPREYEWQAAVYLVNKTFLSIQEMFSTARLIQDWFTECAHLISQIREEPMEWITPLGLPVVQPYTRSSTVRSSFPGDTLTSKPIGVQNNSFQRPNIVKQKNAFPPNFIHSLDSCHMMLTSLFCQRKGIVFVSVHDCFWTHPNKVEIMNKVCREQFISLHSQPILDNLSKFLVEKFGYSELEIDDNRNISKAKLNWVLIQIPKRGDFDLKNVLDSVYFFS